MNTIYIEQFGPIQKAEIDLEKNIQVFIGTQASGKSTICKTIYFCQKIRDYTLDFLMNEEQFASNHPNEYFNNYLKYLTRQFMGCFGKTTHMQKFRICHQFAEKRIVIHLNQDGYVRFSFDKSLKNEIEALMKEASELFLNGFSQNEVRSILDSMTALAVMKQQFQGALYHLFENDKEIIYIPAGRSLLATMSEQLYDVSTTDMDLTMQEFIHLIRNTKGKFGTKIPDMVKNYTKTVKGQINNTSVEKAYELIRRIFKADYTNESDGEKLYFEERHWVKLMYASSGQQEVLWILMLLFIAVLEKRNSFFLIEEPEAHLFPIAQKDIVCLISLMVNATGSKVILTTHSPYILTSWNILLYSEKVEGLQKGKKQTIIPKNQRASFQSFAAYKMEGAEEKTRFLESILDEESHMIRTDYIDEVSSITNKELESLLDMEME